MSWQYYNLNGIILKRINYKESDKLLTIYTTDLGLILAKAKGIRKLNSRKKSHLELFNLAKLYLVENADRYVIINAETIEVFRNIRSQYYNANLAYYVAETFTKLNNYNDPNPPLFIFLYKSLKALEQNPTLDTINAYTVKLLKLLGFFSVGNLINMNESLAEYILNLLKSNYSDIKTDPKHNSIAHKWLKNYTESIIESSIKTLIQ